MRKMTLYRSVLIGILSFTAAFFVGTVANVLCVLDILPLSPCFATHGVLFFVACLVPAVCFFLRLRAGNLFWQPEELSANAAPLLGWGILLIVLLAVWAGSFAAALLL